MDGLKGGWMVDGWINRIHILLLQLIMFVNAMISCYGLGTNEDGFFVAGQ